jgi:hypothetical protein
MEAKGIAPARSVFENYLEQRSAPFSTDKCFRRVVD